MSVPFKSLKKIQFEVINCQIYWIKEINKAEQWALQTTGIVRKRADKSITALRKVSEDGMLNELLNWLVIFVYSLNEAEGCQLVNETYSESKWNSLPYLPMLFKFATFLFK